jgi:hypothetical protein
MDNSTAVCYVNRGGDTRSKSLSFLAGQISSWFETHLTIHAGYLPGHLNVITDKESRTRPDSSYWALDQAVFSTLNNHWECQVDLFSAAWNCKLPKFYAWTPQPGAIGVDAFSVKWEGLKAYAFPPFGLLPRSLAKIRRERATVVLVSPYWPSAPWYPMLLDLAVDVAKVLMPNKKLLTSPEGVAHPLPLLLIAWKLSGNDFKTKAFRKKWSSFCWEERATPHELLSNPLGVVGSVGAVNRIWIPCRLL